MMSLLPRVFEAACQSPTCPQLRVTSKSLFIRIYTGFWHLEPAGLQNLICRPSQGWVKKLREDHSESNLLGISLTIRPDPREQKRAFQHTGESSWSEVATG
jgi:hypothetical protein